MDKVFVSGGSGFIAMYCIKILLSKGYNVVTSVREKSQIDIQKILNCKVHLYIRVKINNEN